MFLRIQLNTKNGLKYEREGATTVHFFLLHKLQKILAKSQSPLQELEGGPRGPYLLVNTQMYLDVIRVDNKSKMPIMPKNLKEL